MKVLIIGSGGREHALAWRFAQSAKVERIYVAPGNGGTALEKKCRNVSLSADPAAPVVHEELIAFVLKEAIGLTVVGSEGPLAAGIVDVFRQAGLAIIGPDVRASLLESSKALSKNFMDRHGVRAAQSQTFEAYEEACVFAEDHFSRNKETPLVIKADGLAAGKGVVVAASFEEADTALCAFMKEGSLGAAGKIVLLEEFLRGVEVSVLAAVSVKPNNPDGASILPFVSARDHKRRYEGAEGPNTGGMGAIAPVLDFTLAAQADFRSSILEPTLRGLVADAYDYRGFIFFGLMVDGDRCSLLEYNVRLGDPETQAVLPLLDSDPAELCAAILDGSLSRFPLAWKAGFSCAPVAVAQGYPGAYRKGEPIAIDELTLAECGAKIFFAGTELDTDGLACGLGKGATEGGILRTSGGRVLAVAAVADSPETARKNAYAGLAAVDFEGMDFRKDIGIES